jgi:hypothetical protein
MWFDGYRAKPTARAATDAALLVYGVLWFKWRKTRFESVRCEQREIRRLTRLRNMRRFGASDPCTDILTNLRPRARSGSVQKEANAGCLLVRSLGAGRIREPFLVCFAGCAKTRRPEAGDLPAK